MFASASEAITAGAPNMKLPVDTVNQAGCPDIKFAALMIGLAALIGRVTRRCHLRPQGRNVSTATASRPIPSAICDSPIDE